MSTLAEQIAAVKREIAETELAYKGSALDAEQDLEQAALLRDVLATLEGMAAPGATKCDHHWIGGNDGLWCTKCKIEQRDMDSPSPQQPTQESKETNFDRWAAKLWLWKNGDHYLAFDDLHPTYDGGDPKTLGEPIGYALLDWDTYNRFAAQRVTAAPVSGEARGQLGRRSDGSLHVRLDALPGFHFILAENEPVECALLPALDEFLRLFLPAATDKARREALENFKRQIDTIMNNHLVEMKEGYDDSIVGFNEAWDIVRVTLDRALTPQNPGDAAPHQEGEE